MCVSGAKDVDMNNKKSILVDTKELIHKFTIDKELDTQSASTTAAISHTQPDEMSPFALVAQGSSVADLLAEWQADEPLQAAGLLHALVCNCVIPLESIHATCGDRVHFLCSEYQRIMEHKPGTRWRGKDHILELIRCYILAYHDPELAFLAVAALWSRFLQIRDQDQTTKRAYAPEAKHILSPFLEMLGMNSLRTELEEWLMLSSKRRQKQQPPLPADDLSFYTIGRELSALMPDVFMIQQPHAAVDRILLSNPQSGAPSSSASPRSASQIMNIDLVVDSEEECYRALFLLHKLYTPTEGGFADSIGLSKANGYRGLQTVVLVDVPTGLRLDRNEGASVIDRGTVDGDTTKQRHRTHFNICTQEMHEINQWGVAAIVLRNRLDVDLPSVWWQKAKDNYAKIASSPLGSLPEMLYVFSPQGELFDFHRGSTVVDYAYHVHSDLAAQSRRFYVNGEAVEPATVLHHLDLVELESDPHAPGPTRVWLNAARTSRARTQIDRFLKRRGQGFYHAQKMIDTRLKALENHYGFDIPEYRVNQAISQEMLKRNTASREELMDDIAAGRLDADRVLHPLFATEIIRQVQIPEGMRLRPNQLTLAQCCRPRPGDNILGRPSQRSGIVTKLKIHRSDCVKLSGSGKAAREGNLTLKWRLRPELCTVAKIEMRARDDDGLLGDAVAQIYSMLPRITLHRSEAMGRHGIAHLRFTLEAESIELIDEITDALRRLPTYSVDEVRHVSLPFSEQEELLHPISSTGINPYTRLPVDEEGMFFGRWELLHQMREWLRSRNNTIWLLGQKRVGKTSLLLHLKNHFLDRKEFVPIFMDFQLLGSLSSPDIFFEVANAVYSELRSDGRVVELGAPLRDMFELDPPRHLVDYIRGVLSHPDVGKLVLLLDEFSRTTDAYQQQRLDENFFQQWRGLIQATGADVKYIVVIQQQAFDSMFERVQGGQEDPSWHLLELGEKLPLKPLVGKDARHLIEWPIRNYLDFPAEALDTVYALTGGSPFLIQAFCFKLVAHLTQNDRSQVDLADIAHVSMEFMSPSESLFAHLLDLIRGLANTVSTRMAQLAEDTPTMGQLITPAVSWQQLAEALPEIEPDRLQSTLQEMCERDIIVAVDDAVNESKSWRFDSLLFQQWLAMNSAPV